MSEITYDDKADLIVDTTIDDIFKVSASDMNEIKNVVNGNAEEVGDITSLTTTDKTSVVNAINELNAPEKWVSVGTTAPENGERVWFKKSKNLYYIPPQTKNGVTLSYDTDGAIVLNGTSTSSYIAFTTNVSLSGSFNLNVSNPETQNSTYVRTRSNGVLAQTIALNYTDIRNVNFTGDLTTLEITIAASGVTFNDFKIYVQLEKGSTATTYEPYVEPSINVDEDLWYKKGGFVDISDTEPTNNASLWVQPTTQNLLDYRNFQTRTYNGIDIVNNNDGTFTINGTATADISAVISDAFLSMSGTWRMLGCPSGGSSSTYMLSAYVGYWGSGSPNIDTGSGTNITYTGNVKVRFYIKSGTTCNNLVFKPMLTTNTSATINDFAPKGPNLYALINGQYQIV